MVFMIVCGIHSKLEGHASFMRINDTLYITMLYTYYLENSGGEFESAVDEWLSLCEHRRVSLSQRCRGGGVAVLAPQVVRKGVVPAAATVPFGSRYHGPPFDQSATTWKRNQWVFWSGGTLRLGMT